MALEKRSPLPIGRYWVDLFKFPDNDQWAIFDQWLRENRELVGVERAEIFDSDPPRQWVLFNVTGGAGGQFLPEWVGIGFPSIAEPEIKTSDDTVQKPDVSELPASPLENMGKVLLVGGGLLLAAVALTSGASIIKTLKGK